MNDEKPSLFGQAKLPDHEVRWTKGAHFPAIRRNPGMVTTGILLDGTTADARARLDYYSAGFGYELREITVEVDRAEHRAEAYFPVELHEVGRPWSLEEWARDCWPVTKVAAGEVMRNFTTLTPEELARIYPMILTRASSKVRAAANPAPTKLRGDFGPDHIEEAERRQPYAGFFALEESNLSFRRFDGTMSADVERAGFVAGDAAIVLPYDPKTDLVLVIEQFRYGPFLRGDTRPWVLEPIAGRIDGGETPEACARREALEEAGLELSRLEHVADYYPSPGAVSEFFYTYIGLADLTPDMGGIGGVAAEAEDIRSHVLPFARLMELVSSGEAGCGPLVLSALWLAANRSRLRGLA